MNHYSSKSIRIIKISILLTFISIWGSISAPPNFAFQENAGDPAASYNDQIQEWRVKNEEKLRAPFGWLALTGHYWLKEGDNSLGSEGHCDVRIPSDLAYKVVGSIQVRGGNVILKCPRESQILINEKHTPAALLKIDSVAEEADGEDIITIGERIKLQLVRRAGRLAMRVRDTESSIRREFKGKRWYETQPAFRVEATFSPYEPVKKIRIVNIQGDTVDTAIAGSLKFKLSDREFQLDAIAESQDSLFVVFKDKSSGVTTYGPGRFLTLDAPVDGKCILDFNKAYNPPCAFSPHTLCPLPPKQNHLELSIDAGEQYETR